MPDPVRKILHIDMDAFFASIEQRDDPSLRGKPVAVGGSRERGVVAAASYEARKYGVRSAMPSVTAKRLCPDLIFVPHRFDVYKEVSSQIRTIFRSYTDLVEPLSLDEAYLDVTENKKGIASAIQIAQEIRQQIFDTCNLTASAGISYNKFLAKTASDLNKPNGQALILPEHAEAFLEALEVEKFFGIGKKTAEKMHGMGIFTGADLKKYTRPELVRHFNKAGSHYFKIVRGDDNRVVNPDRERKSIGSENTFSTDLTTEDEMLDALHDIADRVARAVDRVGRGGRTVTLKIKSFDFEINTRSRTVEQYITDRDTIFEMGKELLRTPGIPEKPVRLLGLTVSNLAGQKPKAGAQLTIF